MNFSNIEISKFETGRIRKGCMPQLKCHHFTGNAMKVMWSQGTRFVLTAKITFSSKTFGFCEISHRLK